MDTQIVKGGSADVKSKRNLIVELARSYKGREGFVVPEHGRRGFRLIGMFVPGMSEQSTLTMNRFLVPDKSAPGWFIELCEDMLAGRLNPSEQGMQLRVRVVGIGGDAMAFAMPRANSREHALVEWNRHLEERHQESQGFWNNLDKPVIFCRGVYRFALGNYNADLLRTGNEFYIADWFSGPASKPYSEVIFDSRRYGGLRRVYGALDLMQYSKEDLSDPDALHALLRKHVKTEMIHQPDSLIELLNRNKETT